MKPTSPVFTPARLGPCELRNRIIRAGAFEGMSPEGLPSERLIDYHRQLAAGGVGLTTVAYCAVAKDGLTFADQLRARPEIEPGLARLAAAVHEQGAACALQIGHAGYFANPRATGSRPLGPSAKFCLFTGARARRATGAELVRLRDDFAAAAGLARRAGFDAVELHVGHGYLLSQFLSAFTNRRRDDYGGSFENRLRFVLEVTAAVRQALGEKRALLAKFNLEDGFRGGLTVDESLQVARALERAGVDALVPSGGFVSKTPFFMMRGEVPVHEMVENESSRLRRLGLRLFGRIFVQRYPYRDLFFFEQARRIVAAVSIPVVLLGGVRSLEQMERALAAGFTFVSLARPLIHDPALPLKLQGGQALASGCEPCNLCVAEMERGGIRCPLADRHSRQPPLTAPSPHV